MDDRPLETPFCFLLEVVHGPLGPGGRGVAAAPPRLPPRRRRRVLCGIDTVAKRSHEDAIAATTSSQVHFPGSGRDLQVSRSGQISSMSPTPRSNRSAALLHVRQRIKIACVLSATRTNSSVVPLYLSALQLTTNAV